MSEAPHQEGAESPTAAAPPAQNNGSHNNSGRGGVGAALNRGGGREGVGGVTMIGANHHLFRKRKRSWMLQYGLPAALVTMILLQGGVYRRSEKNAGGDMDRFVTEVAMSVAEESRIRHRLEALQLDPLAVVDDGDNWQEWKAQWFPRLDRIRAACGPLCAVTNKTQWEQRTREGSSFPFIGTPGVNCSEILSLEELDEIDVRVPFPPPQELLPYFTLADAIAFELGPHLDNADQQNSRRRRRRRRRKKKEEPEQMSHHLEPFVWRDSDIRRMLDKIKRAARKSHDSVLVTNSPYNDEITLLVAAKLKSLQPQIQENNILVIGADPYPWLQVILLHLGANSVVTVDYREVQTKFDALRRTYTPQQLRQAYIASDLPPIDGIVSYSTLQHSGLGLYGDVLNPWADILSVATAWCISNPLAFLALGLPSDPTEDALHFNHQRVYSSIQWSLVTQNWKQNDTIIHEGMIEPSYDGNLFVFAKADI